MTTPTTWQEAKEQYKVTTSRAWALPMPRPNGNPGFCLYSVNEGTYYGNRPYTWEEAVAAADRENARMQVADDGRLAWIAAHPVETTKKRRR